MLAHDTIVRTAPLLATRSMKRNDLPLPRGMASMSGQIAYGSIGLEGSLGYDGLKLTLPPRLSNYEAISAHAPSVLEITLDEPIALVGYLDISSKFRGECRFWVDENWLGDAFFAGQQTREIVLEPGSHRLEITANDKNNRHTVWGVCPATLPKITTTEATPENTAVVTISCYERYRGLKVCHCLTASAAKRGIYLHIRGIGERYQHLQSKVIRLREWLDDLPNRYSYVLYLDGRDTFFLRDLAACCDALNGCGKPILMGMTGHCVPLRRVTEWTEKFPPHTSNRRWPNAGVFMGRRHELTESLAVLADLSKPGNTPYHRFRDDDQHLWQYAWLNGLVPLAPDYECNLVLNINTHDNKIWDGNKDFSFEPELVVRWSGARPVIVHAPGPGKEGDMFKWAGFFHAI